jgi:hypothetical protein
MSVLVGPPGASAFGRGEWVSQGEGLSTLDYLSAGLFARTAITFLSEVVVQKEQKLPQCDANDLRNSFRLSSSSMNVPPTHFCRLNPFWRTITTSRGCQQCQLGLVESRQRAGNA